MFKNVPAGNLEHLRTCWITVEKVYKMLKKHLSQETFAPKLMLPLKFFKVPSDMFHHEGVQ
jgi:hypothetical protein